MKSYLFLLTAAFATVTCQPANVVEEPQQATKHQFINLPDRSDNNPYSNAVLVGNTLYLAGDIGVDPATGKGKGQLLAGTGKYANGIGDISFATVFQIDENNSVYGFSN